MREYAHRLCEVSALCPSGVGELWWQTRRFPGSHSAASLEQGLGGNPALPAPHGCTPGLRTPQSSHVLPAKTVSCVSKIWKPLFLESLIKLVMALLSWSETMYRHSRHVSGFKYGKVSVYVFVSPPNYRVSSKTLGCNYHSPYWHLLLRRELISCRISLLLDPANKLHVTPTDVSGFKTVGTSWTVFPNLPGVNATIVEKLETFVKLWTKLWTNATVIHYFYSPFF